MTMRKAFVFFLIGFLLNLLWEFLHAPFYLGGSYLQGGSVTYWTEFTGPFLPVLLWASAGDGLLLLITYGIVACIERDGAWVIHWRRRDVIVTIVIGLALATFIEWRGLGEGQWGYGPLMPIVPFLDIGLTPFVQLAATGILSYYFLSFPRKSIDPEVLRTEGRESTVLQYDMDVDPRVKTEDDKDRNGGTNSNIS